MNVIIPNSLILDNSNFNNFSTSMDKISSKLFDEIYLFNHMLFSIHVMKSTFLEVGIYNFSTFKGCLNIPESDSLIMNSSIIFESLKNSQTCLDYLVDEYRLDLIAYIRNDRWTEFIGIDGIQKGMNTHEFRNMYQNL